jgi:hypothetical protein
LSLRSTHDLVKGVLAGGRDYDDVASPALTPYIRSANLIVTRVNECAIRKGVTLSTAELVEIETWLAAHMYAMSDQTYASKSTGGASGSFHGQTGLYLDGTKYGQTAQTLDASGCLAAIGKQARARIAWLGKPKSQQAPYSDRD